MGIMSDLFSRWAGYSERVAFEFNKQVITYGELKERIDEKIAFLEKNGVYRKSHVAIKITNPIRYCINFLALWRMDVTIVPIDTQITGEGLLELLAQSDVDVFISDVFDCSNEDLKGLNKACKCFKNIVCYKNDKIQTFKISEGENVVPWETAQGIDSENGFLLLFTSGTSGSGKSKGVLIKKENFLNNAKKVVAYTELTENDSILLTLPLTYCFALSQLLSHLMVCGKCYFTQSTRVTQHLLSDIAGYGVTNYASTPYFFETIEKDYLQNAKLDFHNLRFIMSAGSYLAQGVITQIREYFPETILFNNYGQTEASPRISYNKISSVNDEIESVGKPLPGVEIRIFDETGKEIKDGSVGIIGYKSEDGMEGYYKQSLVNKQEFLLSGDLGYLNEEGKLVIKGRKDSMIKVNGRKVYKNVIEEELYQLPFIKNIRIKKERHRYFGEYFIAYIVFDENYDIKTSLSEIRKYCRKHFDKVSRPKKYVICEGFELNSNQKVVIREEK